MTAPTWRRRRDGWILIALAAWSCRYFFRYARTAYEWPAVDIAPLVARKLDPAFLENDFFTNASAEPSPRHAFGSLVAMLARPLGDDWYAALYLLRLGATFFLPVLWYLALAGYVRLWFSRRDVTASPGLSDPLRAPQAPAATISFASWWAASVAIVVGIAEVVRPDVAAWFSIAWWPPFQPQATSATYSLMCALAGNVLLSQATRFHTGLGVTAWLAASLLHPAVSLFAIVLHGIATFDRWRVAAAAKAVAIGWLVPCLVLAVVCRPTVSLDAETFVRQYVLVRHPHHYWPPEFGSLTDRPWWHSFFLLTGLMLAALPYAAWRRDRRLATLALLLSGTYVGCVALQYAAVVVWPTKWIAMLGPVRFSSLGYFAWLLLAALVAADLANRVVPRRRSAGENAQPSSTRWLHGACLPRGSALVLIAVAAVYFGLTTKDDPFEKARRAQPALYRWIAEDTPRDSVFVAADDRFSVDVALVAQRAIYAGFGFPFREDYFAEYAFRDALAFGTREQRMALKRELASGVDPRRAYFRRLGPRDWVRIARERQLDYVVVESDHAEEFSAILPEFANAAWRVYAVADLRRFVNR